jgi:hypothetical protein
MFGTGDRLNLSFAQLDVTLTLGSIDLTVAGQTIGTGFETSPAAIAAFVSQLEEMYRTLSGAAALYDYLDQIELIFELLDARFGSIRVSGRFSKEAGGSAGTSRPSRVLIRFENLMTDQSALPEFIQGLAE